MRGKILPIVAFAFACASSFSFADDLKQGVFSCFDDFNTLANASLAKEKLRINNFNLREEKSLLSPDLEALYFTASGSNRSGSDLHLTVEMVAFQANSEISFAVTAQPLLSIISSGKTGNIEGSIYVRGNVFAATKKYCVRVVGDF